MRETCKRRRVRLHFQFADSRTKARARRHRHQRRRSATTSTTRRDVAHRSPRAPPRRPVPPTVRDRCRDVESCFSNVCSRAVVLVSILLSGRLDRSRTGSVGVAEATRIERRLHIAARRSDISLSYRWSIVRLLLVCCLLTAFIDLGLAASNLNLNASSQVCLCFAMRFVAPCRQSTHTQRTTPPDNKHFHKRHQ